MGGKRIWICLVFLGFLGACFGDERQAVPVEPASRQTLAKRIYELALETRNQQWARERPEAEFLYRWSVRWMEAERDAATKPTDRLAAWDAHAQRMVKLDVHTQKLQRDGQITGLDAAVTEYFRLEAEEWLSKARASETP